ncbi:nicotinate phosphoribosyltransferase [Alphaproteobacteria bacterium]|nr:nicotinate phosphoribosyltransferase [Alphaproteobacteria bacterium]
MSRLVFDSNTKISNYTDHYFNKTKKIVSKFGNIKVKYAVFMRRPVIFTPRLMIEGIETAAKLRGVTFDIDPCFKEGDWVGAGDPLVYITGSFKDLVDLETLYLQWLGPACVAAYNAYKMCSYLPNVSFLAMDARHCAGIEMSEIMAYAASIGSKVAKKENNAKGFIGNATEATSHFFGSNEPLGTMPHALIGYAGSTVRAAEMYLDVYPDKDMTILVDYFGKEISDTLEVCKKFSKLAYEGKISVRLDTHGGRFIEGLDPQASYAVLENNIPKSIRQYRSEDELRWLVGTGVSAAAIYHMREKLDNNGFKAVKIVASSGFGPAKCKVMASVNAPIDIIGTGSFLPEVWEETYATADIVEYDGIASVKNGREFLLQSN